MNLFKRIEVLFTINRYFTYAVRVVWGFLVARYLGPYYLGIWGFIQLIKQYMVYSNLGIGNAVNTELSVQLSWKENRRTKYIGSAFTMSLVTAGILLTLGAIISTDQFHVFQKYQIDRYAFYIAIYVALTNFQQLFSNLYRIYNQLWRIAIGELLISLSTLTVVFFFSGERLILALLQTYAGALFVFSLIMVIRSPFRLTLGFNLRQYKEILWIGVPLMVYNASVQLLDLMTGTLISRFYTVEIMGQYSFARSLANIVLLGLSTVTWIFYPSVLRKFSPENKSGNNERLVNQVNSIYSTAGFILVFTIILFSPIIFVILPEYKASQPLLNLLLISKGFSTFLFGYNTYLIAYKKQLNVAALSFTAVMAIILFANIFHFFNLGVAWVVVANILGVASYVILSINYGQRLLKVEKRSFPLPLSLVLILIPMILSNIYLSGWYMIGANTASVLLFFLIRFKQIKELYLFVRTRLQERKGTMRMDLSEEAKS